MLGTSAVSERSYRGALYHHCDDLDNRDPAYIGREDVKRTLRRWPHPNTQRKNRAPRPVHDLDAGGLEHRLRVARAERRERRLDESLARCIAHAGSRRGATIRPLWMARSLVDVHGRIGQQPDRSVHRAP